MSDPALDAITNFRILSERIATGGQPSAAQLAAVARAGYGVVINLALHGTEYALPDERAAVTALGMTYEHIPVVWGQPTHADLMAFFDALARHADARVFVHCAMNMRVSAFMLLYRVLRLGWSLDAALPDVHAIWQPETNAVWQAFIAAELQADPQGEPAEFDI